MSNSHRRSVGFHLLLPGGMLGRSQRGQSRQPRELARDRCCPELLRSGSHILLRSLFPSEDAQVAAQADKRCHRDPA